MPETKPRFIALKTKYFEAFRDGRKRHEYRRFCKTWNNVNCWVGRPVTLSHGYSGDRLNGVIDSFVVVSRYHAPVEALELFPGVIYFAKIGIALEIHATQI